MFNDWKTPIAEIGDRNDWGWGKIFKKNIAMQSLLAKEFLDSSSYTQLILSYESSLQPHSD
jgi:hypothetical protein